MTDQELIELFFARSERAIAEVTDQYGALCRGIAYGVLENRQDSEECVSDSMLKLWNSIPPARPQSMMAYLGAIVRNRAIEIYRKRRAQQRGEGKQAAIREELESCVGRQDDAVGADSMVIRETLNAFLKGLNREQQAVFVRRYWAAQPVAEIARELGTNRGRVEGMLHRMREKLKEKLRKIEQKH